MSNHETILKFIKHFSSFGPEVKECFTKGNCYWFAWVLSSRFSMDGRAHADMIYYSQIEGHFVCQIDDKYYDITGEVTENLKSYERLDFIYFKDEALYQRLRRDCVLFIKEGEDEI